MALVLTPHGLDRISNIDLDLVMADTVEKLYGWQHAERKMDFRERSSRGRRRDQ